MGRKIPGKKHKGVKDPLLQRAKRLSELESKINNPPENVEEQHVPKSLLRVIKLQNAVKNNGIVQKRKKKKHSKLIQLGTEQNIKNANPKLKPEKVVPIFNQKPGEDNYRFWNRVNRETEAFIKETEFEVKFNVEVNRNKETGNIEGISKKPKDELDELQKLKSKHKNIQKKKKSVVQNNVKLSKYQKRKQKLLKKKEKQNQNDVDEFKNFKEKIEFGDIVHAPPDLKVHPKNNNKNNKPQQVKNKGLLLNSLFEKTPKKNENKNSIDKKGKRKDLPIGERRQLEKQQSDAIAAYRLMKARKFGESAMSA